MPDKLRYINAGGKLIDLSVPKIMGIINVTPDSFSAAAGIRPGKKLLVRQQA